MAASPVGAITVEQLLRSFAFVTGVRSRIGATGNVFQNAYNLGPDGPVGQAPVPPGFDAVTWDYFDNTRTMSEVRPALSGPARVIPQKAGTASAALLRSYEALLFEANRIAGFRPFGKPVGTIGKSGEDYVARQTKFLLQKQMNMWEFACSRVFRNGFDIKTTGGDRQILTEAGSGTIQVRYQIPTNHTLQLALGAAAANLLDATWATASTDVIKHVHLLFQAAERESGIPIELGWISSLIYIYLINNDKLRAAGGSAFRVWEELQTKRMQTLDGIRRRGEDVTFRALPQIIWKVYDGVLNVEQDRDSLDIADNTLFVPNDKVIFTPAAGDWLSKAVGQEIFQEQYGGQKKVVEGSHHFVRNVVEPTAGSDLHVWSKGLPILYVPKAVYYPTVTGF